MRRGRIPVANFRSEEHKNRSRSRVREPDYNKNDPIDCDNFTLIEDNIALREDNKALKLQIAKRESSKLFYKPFPENCFLNFHRETGQRQV